MGERAKKAVLINFQIPYNSGQQDDRAFYKEIALFGNPCFIEIQHNCVCRLISIRNIGHKGRIDRITAVRTSRIVKIYDVKFRRFFITMQVGPQMVIRYGRKIVEFKIINVHGEAFLDLLLNERIDDTVSFSAARRSDDGN